MACVTPLPAWRKHGGGITFSIKDAFIDQRLELPCGKCTFCRLEYSRQWAVRAQHEASLYDNNCFITLTYNKQHLPKHRALDLDAPTKFMRRLRKEFGPDIRSFGCAEYGDKHGRPHYHLAIFNHDFTDKDVFKIKGAFKLYRSRALEELWPYGYSSVGGLSFQSAAYIARYVTKKMSLSSQSTPEAKQAYYKKYLSYSDIHTRAIKNLRPTERGVSISRMPGIGKAWFEKHWRDVYPRDEIVIDGVKQRPPRYYDRLLELANPELYLKVKIQRSLQNKTRPNIDTLRAIAKAEFKQLQFRKLIRSLEDYEDAA